LVEGHQNKAPGKTDKIKICLTKLRTFSSNRSWSLERVALRLLPKIYLGELVLKLK